MPVKSLKNDNLLYISTNSYDKDLLKLSKYNKDDGCYNKSLYNIETGIFKYNKNSICKLDNKSFNDLLNDINKSLKVSLWSDNCRKMQLKNDKLKWFNYCKLGDSCQNKYNYKCGYYHESDNIIKDKLVEHYTNYPSYVPNSYKVIECDYHKKNNCNKQENCVFAHNKNELRVLPKSYDVNEYESTRKFFTWLHIKKITELRIDFQ